MRSMKSIHIIQAHAEGEVGDVIVGGVAPPPGDTIWEQSRFIASDQTLRNFVLNEPRGGVFRHVNLLVPPKNPKAQMGFIIMEPEDTPPMSGSNCICVATGGTALQQAALCSYRLHCVATGCTALHASGSLHSATAHHGVWSVATCARMRVRVRRPLVS